MPRPPREPAALAEYRRKRDFAKTAEPSGREAAGRSSALRFVVQKHAASHLHFDFRLELGGVMKSWAVPKGPSVEPGVKRLAMEVEDHPISYNAFEGTIPAGQYGGGTVMLWDRGTYGPADGAGEPALRRAYEAGRIDLVLAGERLRGAWTLVRTSARGAKAGGKPQWLLIKRTDDGASPGTDVVAAYDTSVATGRTMEEIAGGTRATKAAKRANAKRANAKRANAKTIATKRATSKGAATKRTASTRGTPPVAPMYASVGTAIPDEPGWTFEPKYDGIRVLAFATKDDARLVTRNGNDKAAQFPEVADALRALARRARRARRALVLDGEIVALVDGRPARFQSLQSRMHVRDAAVVASHAEATPATLVAFDLLVDGDDVLTDSPWSERRARLERRLAAPRGERIQLGATDADGHALVAWARAEGWEGVIAKRTDAPYEPGVRAKHWRKLKVEHRQEFVVGGYTAPRNTRQHLGALLLGYYDDAGRLVYAGHAGGGFTGGGLAEMARLLAPLGRATSPFAEPVKTNERAHWVTPRVVVEVKFVEWTADGRLRQPIVLGVRDDKDAREVGREGRSVQRAAAARARRRPDAPPDAPSGDPPNARRGARGAGTTVVERLARIEADGGDGVLALPGRVSLELSSLRKPFFPADGYTKGDLLRYYAEVAAYVLPAVDGRPLVLRRFPNGIEGKAFYQHEVLDAPAGVRTALVDLGGAEPPRRYLVGGTLATVLHAVQLGAVSLDPFHGRVDASGAVDVADYAVIDLDPGPRASFARVVEVARHVKAALDALGLRAGLKTSGASGLHIVLPLPARATPETALLLAQLVATRVAAAHPRVATVERSLRARAADAVYVDYLQNVPGKTVAAAYSVRARPGATVSTPLRWDELGPELDPRAFTIRTVPARLAATGDLWRTAMRDRNTARALRALRASGG